ncbi:F-box domain-containing protein [Favolaschia claudopus]|uniref:F-box domain-containing protein n=1 Tax=Favolaschia claudopus TaxID=2862362 RepID=A0AAW0CA79_9AGAR
MLSTPAADRARMLELETQIADLEHALAGRKLEQLTVKKRLDAVKYPVLTLPNEIVSEILIHCLPPYPECPPLVGPSSPIPLTHICRKWRQIALTTPQLWRAVLLHTQDLPSDLSGIWLSRSGSCPISIDIQDYTYSTQASRGEELLEAVLPYCARWEYVDLGIDNVDEPVVEGAMPLLRHLSALTGTMHGNLDFSQAPRLRSVSLHADIPPLVLPWTQLTSMHLFGTTLINCVPFLEPAINLIHLKIDLYIMDEDEQDTMESFITLPFLESFTWRPHPGTMNNCLSHFILPNLSRLVIDQDILQSDPIASLTSFVSRSSCPLECLIIVGDEEPLSEQSYRAALPSVKKLVVASRYDKVKRREIESHWVLSTDL